MMDAKVISTGKLPIRPGTENRACSGRTLAEMAAHIFRRNKRDDIIRLDVACGTVEWTQPHTELAERANGWRPRRVVLRSGAAGKHVHVFDTVVITKPSAVPARKKQCHAYN